MATVRVKESNDSAGNRGERGRTKSVGNRGERGRTKSVGNRETGGEQSQLATGRLGENNVSWLQGD